MFSHIICTYSHFTILLSLSTIISNFFFLLDVFNAIHSMYAPWLKKNRLLFKPQTNIEMWNYNAQEIDILNGENSLEQSFTSCISKMKYPCMFSQRNCILLRNYWAKCLVASCNAHWCRRKFQVSISISSNLNNQQNVSWCIFYFANIRN